MMELVLVRHIKTFLGISNRLRGEKHLNATSLKGIMLPNKNFLISSIKNQIGKTPWHKKETGSLLRNLTSSNEKWINIMNRTGLYMRQFAKWVKKMIVSTMIEFRFPYLNSPIKQIIWIKYIFEKEQV